MSLKNLNATKIPKFLKNKLNNFRINQIYKSFEKSLNINEDFIVAVSGGPDSLALAFLAKIYSIKKKVKSKFYIVDHKLRSDSTKEANLVKKILKKNLIHGEILTWHGKKPVKNVQSLARKKRYDLLIVKSRKLKIKNILLGHHQDDLFENFFIRLLRGSGLKGIISLDKKTKIEEINLLRPLLDQKKEDLVFISEHVFNFYVKDPFNNDEKFLRIGVRRLINELKKKGLDRKKFNTTLKNLKYSNDVISFYVTKNLEKNTLHSYKKNRIILNKDFFKQPYEVVFRSFSDSLNIINGKYYPVRGKKIDKILNEIQENSFLKGTLGGCILEKVNQTIIISKE
jgi:tRNA(Ile)-lysidine synthase